MGAAAGSSTLTRSPALRPRSTPRPRPALANLDDGLTLSLALLNVSEHFLVGKCPTFIDGFECFESQRVTPFLLSKPFANCLTHNPAFRTINSLGNLVQPRYQLSG